MSPVHNERVKLLATTINTVALALILGGFVAPAISGQTWGNLSSIAWFTLGAALHACAQIVLGKMRE